MELQVGKRYRTRCGDVVLIDRAGHPDPSTCNREFYQFSGLHEGTMEGWRRDGRYFRKESRLDLIEEVADEQTVSVPVTRFGVVVEQPLVPRSYVRNCILIQRGSEMLFNSTDAGILATLDGYAVIPRELYDELARR